LALRKGDWFFWLKS